MEVEVGDLEERMVARVAQDAKVQLHLGILRRETEQVVGMDNERELELVEVYVVGCKVVDWRGIALTVAANLGEQIGGLVDVDELGLVHKGNGGVEIEQVGAVTGAVMRHADVARVEIVL